LPPEDDEALSRWTERELSLSLWPYDDVPALERLETAVLRELLPPLNLNKVGAHSGSHVRAARKRLAEEARAWRA
jgi:hypothetical protein